MMVSHTNGTTSHSASRTADTNKITIVEPLWGQMVSGWVTITQVDMDSTVLYGPFDTMEKAVEWGGQLINASIEPVYVPSYNRG